MAFTKGFSMNQPNPERAKPKYKRGEKPAVPEGGAIRVSGLGLAPRLVEQVGGPDEVLYAVDAELRKLVRSWADATPYGAHIGEVAITDRKDYDKGSLGYARQQAVRGQLDKHSLIVCRDSARITAVSNHTLIPNVAMVDAIYSQVKAARKSWQPKNVYASGIKNDARQQVFALLGIPESDVVGADNPEWLAVAEFGTALHELGEGWLKALGILKRAEFRVRSDCGSVSGRGDAELELAGDDYIADLKTVGRRDFDQGAHGRKFDKYIAQLNVYGHILGLRKGMVILFCRDSGRMQEFIINLRPGEGAGLIGRARDIMGYFRSRIVPPSESAPRDMMFNPYRSLSKLEDETGWVQRALDDGVDPTTITAELLRERYAEEMDEVPF